MIKRKNKISCKPKSKLNLIYTKKEAKRKFKCETCGMKFDSFRGLSIHTGQEHKHEEVKEISLLEQGFVPDESKAGGSFKGKNKIIIAKSSN